MSERRRLGTAIGAIIFVVAGFFVGAFASAWMTRDARAEPWRKMRVEHEGTEGTATRTRVVFQNPKLPLQAIELSRDPEGKAQTAIVSLQDATVLTVRFEDGKPSSLESATGSKALFAFKGEKARVAFFTAKGKEAGDKVVLVPVGLQPVLGLAALERRSSSAYANLSLIGEAWAQDGDEGKEEEEDPNVTVVRYVELSLDVSTKKSKKDDGPGLAQIDANCEGFTCIPVTKEITTPGVSTVRVAVSGSKKKSELDEPASSSELSPFKKSASEERETATKVLPDVGAAIAAVAVTAEACRSLDLGWSLCVKSLSNDVTAAAAILSVTSHEVEVKGREVDKRAEALYFEDQAREALDAETKIEVCVNRDGFARACTEVSGRPLSEDGIAKKKADIELKRGIGGTLVGSFAMTQSDGAGCKFSPSPKTSGTLKMSFDNEKGVVTATLSADGKGTRSNLRCNLGSANMRWSTSYSATLTQTFSNDELLSGGKLSLKMTGSMKGTGSYSFSNCRSTSGVSGSCPAGKSEPYSYPLTLVGQLDLDTRRGTGRLIVSEAPLGTRGTWQIPKAGGDP